MTDNVAKKYGWSTAEQPHSCEYISTPVLLQMKKLKVGRVADLGSGNGRLCADMSEQGIQSVGIEYDADGVAIAKSAYPQIPFYNFGVQSDPAELLADEARFDAVVSTEVIEHLFSPQLLPMYASKILKDNGYLIVSTPYHGYLKNLFLSVLNKWDSHFTSLWHGGHIKFWSRRTLTTLLEQNGFSVIDFKGVGRAPYLWKSMIVTAVKLDDDKG